jgi:cytochrome c oxidase cbb3-type subunit 3
MQRRAAIFVVLLAASACGEEEPAQPLEIQAEAATPAHPGEALYRRYCALCHGRDGEGYAADDAPALASQEFLRSASDQFINSAIEAGRPGTPMSAWSREHGGPLEREQIGTILQYMRTWQRDPPLRVDALEVRGDASRGRAIFAERCATCHGARGEGVDAIALANPALQATASDGFLLYAVTHGRRGTRMPSFEGTLTSEQIEDVVRFVRTFGAQAALPEAPSDVDIPPLTEMQLVINPDARPPRFTLREDRYVPALAVKEALDRGQRIIVIDARSTSDWLRARVPGAIPVPFYELSGILDDLPRDGTPMVAYCGCPHAASGRVVDALREAGFTNTSVMDEGIGHWQTQGYPIESGIPETAEH